MQLTLFWIFSAIMILSALGVIFFRNPVTCAISLVGSFVGLAALFMTLDAFFIGIVQILVYAGAVMVLFLFIIMLLNIRAEKRRRLKFATILGGMLVVFCFLGLLTEVLFSSARFSEKMPALVSPTNDVAMIGLTLFRSFNLPFQIIGVLLLTATVGVVVLSRRTLK